MTTKAEARAVAETYKVTPANGAAAAYAVALGVIEARLEGNRFAARRPPCQIKVSLGKGLIEALIKPELVNSPTGWQVAKVFLTLTTNGGRTLKLRMMPDGTLLARRWSISTAPALMGIAASLLEMVGKGTAHLLAFADADYCINCGRVLTDPASRDLGVGPECIRLFIKTHDDTVEAAKEALASLAEQIKDIRRQIMDAHPDRGGSGDGELFASLTRQLDALRQQQSEGGRK